MKNEKIIKAIEFLAEQIAVLQCEKFPCDNSDKGKPLFNSPFYKKRRQENVKKIRKILGI